MGRAPIVKMSRRMPPTPVAAPWNGSTALGWLWLSTFMTMARPSPMSTDAGVLLAGAHQDPWARPSGSACSSGRECW